MRSLFPKAQRRARLAKVRDARWERECFLDRCSSAIRNSCFHRRNHFVLCPAENHPNANEHDRGAEKRPKRKLFTAEGPAEHHCAWWCNERDCLQIGDRHAWQQPIEQEKSER